jgi:hypothetical protein
MLTPPRHKTHRLTDPYITAGPHLYVIGTQDGLFPALGDHIPGKMGGVWAHPQRLLDGFRIGWRMAEGATLDWPGAIRFVAGPWFSEFVYDLTPELQLIRRQWVDQEAPILRVILEVRNAGASPATLDVVFTARSDLHPGWLDEGARGVDTGRLLAGGLGFVNEQRGWWAAVTSESPAAWSLGNGGAPGLCPPGGSVGHGVCRLVVGAGRSSCWVLAITGGTGRLPDVVAVPRWEGTWQARARRAQGIEAGSRVEVEDPQLAGALQWSKFQVDWLVRSVPGVGCGLGAGVPEYPWWFSCDNHYALQGVLAFGGHELAQHTLELLAEASHKTNGDGRIIHEMSTTGRVYNPGNQQESPQFVTTVWDVYQWTGDRAWLQKMFTPARRALAWVLAQDKSGRGLAPGPGIIEIEGLDARMIDTAAYTAAGLGALSRIAETLGDSALAEDAVQRSHDLTRRLLDLYWEPRAGMFGDCLADPVWLKARQPVWAARATERDSPGAAARYLALPTYGRPGGEVLVLMKNWIISVPLELGLAPAHMADSQLRRMRDREFHGPHGLYLSATDRREMMTISTGVQAVAEIRYGNPDAALAWMKDIAGTLDTRMPGSISEMSPDYGCFVQAWTAYGLWVPLVKGFFGLAPDAGERRVRFAPAMPRQWRRARLHDVRIGQNRLSVHFERDGGHERWWIRTAEPWRVDWADGFQVTSLDGRQVSATAVEISRQGTLILSR